MGMHYIHNGLREAQDSPEVAATKVGGENNGPPLCADVWRMSFAPAPIRASTIVGAAAYAFKLTNQTGGEPKAN